MALKVRGGNLPIKKDHQTRWFEAYCANTKGMFILYRRSLLLYEATSLFPAAQTRKITQKLY